MPHSFKPRALDDLGRIYAQGMERWGEEHAEAYLEGLHDVLDFLADHPRIARLRTELSPPVRAYRYRAHLILYDLGVNDRILILRVRHGREDWVSEPL